MAIDLTKIARDHAARQKQKTQTSLSTNSKARLLDDDGNIDLTGIALAHKKGLRLYEDEEYANDTPESRLDMDYVGGMSDWLQDANRKLNTLYGAANRETTPWGQQNRLASNRESVSSLMQAAQEYMDYIQTNEDDLASVVGRGTLDLLERDFTDTLSNLMRYDRESNEANRGALGAVNRYLATDEGQAQIEPYLRAQEEEEAAQEAESKLSLAQQTERLRQAQYRQAELDEIAKRIDPMTELGGREYDQWLTQSRQIEDDIADMRAGITRATRENKLTRAAETARSDPEFDEYVQRGASIQNDAPPSSWLDTIGRALQGGSQIGNPVTYARSQAVRDMVRNQNETPWGSASRNAVGGVQTMYDNPMTLYWFMTDDEVATYNYLLAKDQEDGTDNAHQYLLDLNDQLTERRGQTAIQDVDAWARGNPALASASSVLASPVNGLAFLESGINYLQGQSTNAYSPTQLQTRGATASRAAVADEARQQIAEATGQEWLGDSASFVYQTGMSVADSLLNTAIGAGLFGAGSAASALSSALMGGNAASSAYQDAIDRGARDDQALAAGLWSGIFETLFEKFSIENFIGTASMASKSGMVLNVLRQMGIEASEETATEIANVISDSLIMGELSNYQQTVNEYMAQGMSESEAKNRAAADLGLQVIEAGLGGALSGGVMGTAGTAISAGRTRSMASKAIRTDSVDLVIDQALTLDPSSASYAIAQQLRNGDMDSASSGDVARLVRAMAQEDALTPEIMERINTPVQEDTEAQTLSEDDPLLREAQAMVEEVAQEQRARTTRTEAPSAAVRSAPAVDTTFATRQAPVTTRQATPSQTAQTPRREAPKSGGTKTTTRRKSAQKTIADALERARTSDTQTEITSAHIPAVDAQTNERIEIAGVDEVSPSGAVTLRADDGSVLAYSDVQFSDPRVKQLYDSVSALRNTNAARTFVSSYDADAGISVSEYASGFYPIYNAAIEGESFEAALARSSKTAALSPAQQQAAYMAGQNIYNIAQESRAQEEAEAAAKKQQDAPKKQRKKKAKQPAQETPAADTTAQTQQTETRRRGGVSYEIDESTLTDRQRAGLENAREVESVIDALARLGGAEVVIVPHIGHEGGLAQGAYLSGTNLINLSLETEDPIEYVAMHELTHYIRSQDEESYYTLLDIVSRALTDGGEDVNALVKAQMDRFGYDGDEALEEVVCNTIPAILSDSAYVDQLARADKTLAERIRDFFVRLVDTLKTHFQELSSDAPFEHTRTLVRNIDALEEIERVFDASLAKISREGGSQDLAQTEGAFDADEPTYSSIATEDIGDAKFSMKKPVERKGTLLAIHNLTEEKLQKFLALGGAPMPSIAVTRSDIEHSNFGDISLVFDKSTIDPKSNRRNTVYSADAWTPTFPAIEYEVNSQVEQRVSRRIRELSRQVDPLFQDELRGIQYGLEDNLNRHGGEEGLVRAAMDNYGLKAAYLEEQGQHISAATTRREVDQGFRADRADRYQAIAYVLGTEDPEVIASMSAAEVRDQYGDALEEAFPGVTKSNQRLGGILRQTQAYLENRGSGPAYETVTDSAATRRAIDAALDQTEYERWVQNLYDGIEGASGVRNGKDQLTPSGNRRSFAQTHYPVTLENLAKAMSAQNNGNTKNVSGFNGVKTLRAGMAQRFKNIAEMHKLEGRLRNLSQKEMDAISNALSDRMYDLMARIDDTRTHSGQSNDLMRMDRIGETMMEIADSGKYSAQNIQEAFANTGMPIDANTAEDVRTLLFDIQQMPVNLFEAKPERAVYANEVRLAVLPDGKYPDVEERLAELGIPVTHYDESVAGDRLRVMNSEATDALRFSIRPPEDANVNRLTRDNKRLKDALENARAQVRIVRGSRIQQSRLERIANRFVREYKSKYDSAKLANELRQIYEIAESDGDVRFDDLDAIGIGIAKKVVEQSRALDTDAEALYSDLRDRLRGVTIRLTPELRQQITESYGSVSNFRRVLRNLVSFDERKGIDLDVLLGDIKSQYPWLETEDISPMTLEAIADLTRRQYINPFGDSIDSEAAYLWTRIQEAYADAQLPETFAERKKAEIDRLRKQMRELRNDQHAQDIARMRERLNKQREEYQARLANQATAFREREARQRAKRNEGAERRRYRERIQASAKTLSDWLAAPSDKRFVPEYLRNAVAQYVANVDVGYRLDTKARQKWTDRMVSMLEAVRRAGTAPPEASADLEFDSETMQNIEELTTILRNAPKNKAQQDMTVAEMKMLSDTLQAIKHQIINADKLFVNGRRESIATVGEDTIERALGRKNKRHNDALKKVFGNRMAMGIMKPYYFFREMGGDLRALGDDLFRGESDWARITKQEKDWYDDIKKKYHYDRWANRKNDELKFTAVDGERVSLTREQAMYIYAVDNRERLESGTNHLRGGGIVTDLDRRGRPKDDSTAHSLSNEDIQRISDWLTDEQKAYADELVSNLSTTMAAYGNRTSMRLVGYKKFTGEHYIPIRVHGDYVQSEVGSDSSPGAKQTRQSARLKNRGFTKSIAQGANNPLVAADITDVWARHVQDMASYAALAIQQDNLIRVYNYKRPNMPGAQQATVKSALTTGYGRQTRQYLDRLNADIGGTVMVDPRDSLMSAMLSRFKKGAVMASLSVAIQQPTAYLRALAVLPVRDMRPGWLGAFREAQRYAGTAIIKDIGGFDMQTGGSATDWLRGSRPQNIVEWADEIGGILPEKADAITWGAIWNSVKRNVRRTTKLKPGSQEFFQECGKRFDNVIRMTQVYDSTLSRADFMRGRSQYLSMVTSFMAEPMTSMNLLIDSIYHQKDKRMQGRVSVRAAAVAFAASTIINAVAKSVVYAMRDDDDELTFWEKYQQELRNALLGEPNAWIPGAAGQVVGFLTGSDLSPLGQLPIISDVASMVQGYDVSRTDMDAISRVISAAQGLLSDNRTTYYKVREFVGAVSTLVGVPVRNLWRDVEGIARTIGVPVPATSTNESTQTGSFQRAYQALIDGDKTAYQRYMDRAEQMIRESMDERVEEDGVTYLNYEVEVQNRLVEGLRDALKEDPRIQQMARYVSSENWDLDQYERMRAQLIREGFPEAAITGAVNSARNDIEDTGEIESTPYGPDEWTRDDLQLAIEYAIQTGDLSDVEAIQQDMLTQSDTYWQMIPQAPEDYVKAAARKAYQATGVSSNDRNALQVLELFGYSQEDVVGWEQDEMRQTMYDFIDSGDYRQANQQIAKMRNSGMDADGIRDGVRTKYKKLIQEAQVAGDTQRVRELRSTLMNLNLYTSKGSVYFTPTMIDEWIRDAGKTE